MRTMGRLSSAVFLSSTALRRTRACSSRSSQFIDLSASATSGRSDPSLVSMSSMRSSTPHGTCRLPDRMAGLFVDARCVSRRGARGFHDPLRIPCRFRQPLSEIIAHPGMLYKVRGPGGRRNDGHPLDSGRGRRGTSRPGGRAGGADGESIWAAASLVVTGAAQGIGAEIAAQAAASGAGGLLLTDRNGALGREVAARLGARPVRWRSWRRTSPRSRVRGR